ncbi:MAG TPA: NTP transferase domain-containing protein [Gemmatimonadales bacterium]|nr:NTP transferase domain-containing protein [Gemmatimonadales bacterium]
MSAPALVILAAGVGSRFGGPKQLSSVGPSGETLLDYAIYDAKRAGFTRAVLVIREELRAPLREHVARVIGAALPVDYVEQRLDGLPRGRRVPAGRVKPWGTGHAVLAAREAVDGPFAVCNADDYYGPGAYRLLAEHLAANAGTPPLHALVGYRLDETLSDHGGVARAVASTGPDGLVARLVEVKDLTAAGKQSEFTGAESVSMNLWGFTPDVLPPLEEQFRAFLDAPQRGPDAEFLLSTALGDQVTAGRARLRVLPAPDRWLGMTFAADVEAVRAALAALVRAGAYPADLRAAFTRL